MSNVDECEKNIDEAFRINAIGSRNIAAAAQRFDAAVIYISTDYVFDGANPPLSGYREMDTLNPINVYGKSKLWGEYYISRLLNKYYIIRTSWLFGKGRDNFISAAASGNDLRAADDMVSSPTYVKDLAFSIRQLLEMPLSLDTGHYGIFHITNSGHSSRYEIASYVAKLMNISKDKIKKVKINDLNLAAARPNFSAMDNFVWRLSGFKPLRTWQEAVKDYLTEIQR